VRDAFLCWRNPEDDAALITERRIVLNRLLLPLSCFNTLLHFQLSSMNHFMDWFSTSLRYISQDSFFFPRSQLMPERKEKFSI
jgi:hypothetical protein